MVRESQLERATMQSRFALAAAESGANETLQYLVSARVQPLPLEEPAVKEVLEKRWVTNDGRYSAWGFPTNEELKILAQPEELDQGGLFYVSGFQHLSEEESEIYSLGLNFDSQKEEPLLRLIKVHTVEETIASTNFLQGELIACQKLNILGEVRLLGTTLMASEEQTNLLVRVVSPTYPSQDIFLGSNVIQGYFVIASPNPPPGLDLPEDEETEVVTGSLDSKENVLLVGSAEFLEGEKEGYETNHFVTRLNWTALPAHPAPEDANCTEAPLVNIGTEEEPVMAYQFEAAGDYKITAADPYPMVLKSGAVINLRLPADYVLSEQPVTMEEGAQMALFPDGNLTLGAQAFAAVEKNWKHLTVWGGASDAEAVPQLILLGAPETLLYARIYAPSTDVVLTNEMSLGGLLVGREISMAPKSSFLGDLQARQQPLIDSSIAENTTNVVFRIKTWEEIDLMKEKEETAGGE